MNIYSYIAVACAYFCLFYLIGLAAIEKISEGSIKASHPAARRFAMWTPFVMPVLILHTIFAITKFTCEIAMDTIDSTMENLTKGK